jgi:hypothetical protein
MTSVFGLKINLWNILYEHYRKRKNMKLLKILNVYVACCICCIFARDRADSIDSMASYGSRCSVADLTPRRMENRITLNHGQSLPANAQAHPLNHALPNDLNRDGCRSVLNYHPGGLNTSYLSTSSQAQCLSAGLTHSPGIPKNKPGNASLVMQEIPTPTTNILVRDNGRTYLATSNRAMVGIMQSNNGGQRLIQTAYPLRTGNLKGARQANACGRSLSLPPKR